MRSTLGDFLNDVAQVRRIRRSLKWPWFDLFLIRFAFGNLSWNTFEVGEEEVVAVVKKQHPIRSLGQLLERRHAVALACSFHIGYGLYPAVVPWLIFCFAVSNFALGPHISNSRVCVVRGIKAIVVPDTIAASSFDQNLDNLTESQHGGEEA